VITNEGKDDVHTGGGEGVRCVRLRLQLQNKGRYNVQPGGVDMLDRSCDYKTTTRTTYQLEVEMEGDVSDRGCDYKTKAETTYGLDVKREGDVSDRSCD
jgi:hypothetical protein